MRDEVRIDTHITDPDDLSYELLEIERQVAVLLDEGFRVIVSVRAIGERIE